MLVEENTQPIAHPLKPEQPSEKSVLFLLEKLKHKQKKKIKVHIGNGTTMVFVSRDVTSMFSSQ